MDCRTDLRKQVAPRSTRVGSVGAGLPPTNPPTTAPVPGLVSRCEIIELIGIPPAGRVLSSIGSTYRPLHAAIAGQWVTFTPSSLCRYSAVASVESARQISHWSAGRGVISARRTRVPRIADWRLV